jgi:hypothetical protein
MFYLSSYTNNYHYDHKEVFKKTLTDMSMKPTFMSASLNTICPIILSMTITKKILTLPVLATLISVLAVSAQDTEALVSTVNDERSCKSPAVGGTLLLQLVKLEF